MAVHLELHANPCGTLRLYDAGSYEQGSEYRIALTAEVTGKRVMLHGADKPLSLQDYKEIRTYLGSLGFEAVQIKRKGRWKTFRILRPIT